MGIGAGQAPRPGASQPVQRLFIALMLPSDAAGLTAAVGRDSRARGLTGADIRTDRLHVTLVHVGDYEGELPTSEVGRVARALDRLSMEAVDLVFDQAGGFAGASGAHPHVLLGGAGLDGVRTLRQAIWDAVRGAATTHAGPPFTPHVTLMYADRLAEARAITPIRWTATELVLIHSEVGRSIHHTLGRWPLRGRAA